MSCINSVWFLAVRLENGNPPTYYIIQVINRLLLDVILTLRAYQINEVIHPKTVAEFFDWIILVFVERFEVGLATGCLIAHFIFEGLFCKTLAQVDCTGFGFTECKTKIDFELESHGFSVNSPSYAGIILTIIALGGILRRLPKAAAPATLAPPAPAPAPPIKPPPPPPTPFLIKVFQGWSIIAGIIICTYHSCRIIYWSSRVDQSILLLFLLSLRILISCFITYDIYFVNENGLNLFHFNFRLKEL
ncbi:hypothetical protein Glove_177g25 [Diversispora epigaea]|uniref:Uncharacterized protein n=1 Tax=Diversispora epigaea TaxID=1348612 RepID=A0A397IX83_9GLOM|nr:hypothetical protein Glove_177g25 [Diversispora epigaea]